MQPSGAGGHGLSRGGAAGANELGGHAQDKGDWPSRGTTCPTFLPQQIRRCLWHEAGAAAGRAAINYGAKRPGDG
jgi:hypothetical protein